MRGLPRYNDDHDQIAGPDAGPCTDRSLQDCVLCLASQKSLGEGVAEKPLCRFIFVFFGGHVLVHFRTNHKAFPSQKLDPQCRSVCLSACLPVCLSVSRSLSLSLSPSLSLCFSASARVASQPLNICAEAPSIHISSSFVRLTLSVPAVSRERRCLQTNKP